MNPSAIWTTMKILAAIAVLLLTLYLISQLKKIKDYFSRVGFKEAFNPLSENNAAITAANTVTEKLSGDPSFGGWVYSTTHDDPTSQPAIDKALQEAKKYATPSYFPENPSIFFTPITPFNYGAP